MNGGLACLIKCGFGFVTGFVSLDYIHDKLKSFDSFFNGTDSSLGSAFSTALA
jgi:hypothetical protein